MPKEPGREPQKPSHFLGPEVALRAEVDPPSFLSEPTDDGVPAWSSLRRAAIVRPHWDGAVRTITDGGYRDLLQLRRRLAKRSRSSQHLLDRLRRVAIEYVVSLEALEAERVFWGDRRTIGQSVVLVAGLDLKQQAAGGGVWSVISDDGETVKGYRLEVAPEEPQPEAVDHSGQASGSDGESGRDDAVDLWRPFQPEEGFNPDITWQQAIDLVRAEGGELLDFWERSGRYAETVQFRLRVVEAVLEEYEVLGHVPLWDEKHRPGRMERLASDPVVSRICEALVTAFDSSEKPITSRDQLYFDAAHLLGPLEGFSGESNIEGEDSVHKDTIRNRLKKPEVNIHRSKGTPGRPKADLEAEELRYVIEQARIIDSYRRGQETNRAE